MMNINYQKKLDSIIQEHIDINETPTLLLHSCCAPCSSYVLEYLSVFFKITVFYYNPNIYPQEEYERRVKEQARLISQLNVKNGINFIEGDYDSELFINKVKGYESEPEGGARCMICYRLRLEVAAKQAIEGGFDYFTTTLSISPHKNATILNEIGEAVAKQYGVTHLSSDFKKKNGYKRSIELSKEYDLYRQEYCGCEFSMNR